MIWTVKIVLLNGLYATSPCTHVIEMDSGTTLEDLHLVIQQALHFGNDHLYAFFIARTPRGRDRIRYDDENGDLYGTKLADLFPLPKGRKLFYYFDYGDCWVFEVSRTRKAPFAPRPGIRYPSLIETIGENPQQYPRWEE